MNTIRKGWDRVAIVARVAAAALVLVCAAPGRMEARAPMLATSNRVTSSAALSAADWSTVQARLARAGAHVPLVTSHVRKLTASDAAENDWFGGTVAVSGDTVVVGTKGDDAGTGAAYVFERNYDPGNPGTPLADNWGQVAKLTAVDAAVGDHFGTSVAISGDTVVVGADDDDDAGESSGSAYVFERNQGGPDSWGQVHKLTAADAALQDYFGTSVAISGDTVVVGADGNDDAGSSSGAAYVFERNYDPSNPGTPLADNWGQRRKLTADASLGDHFGNSVAISGDTIVIGAYWDDDEGGYSGSAHVFERNRSGADNWGRVQKLTAADVAVYDHFGASVAISGDTVVVGADGDDNGGESSGSAYVFERNHDPDYPTVPKTDNWGQVRKLTASDAAQYDYFGASVTISGDTVVVGAAGNNLVRGAAYLFERNRGGADNWGQDRKLTASDVAAYDHFGESVAISGNTVVVGMWGDDDNGDDSGSGYVFARGGAAWEQQQKPVSSEAAAYDYFGFSVAVSGDTFIAGAPYDDAPGAAYLFYRNEGGADQWGKVRKKPGAGGTGAEFGWSVAIDVDTVVVGAPDVNKAYVFERNGGGADQWGYVKTLTDTTDADFGNSVAISGDTVVVGAPFDDVACSNCGAAYVYERNYDPSNPGTPVADIWGLRAVLTATVYPADGDRFGWSVAISGDTVVVGAPYDTHSSKSEAGSAYVFKRNYDGYPWTPEADNWGLVRNVTASDASTYDYFGWSVAISGDTFVVGAYGADAYFGAAYVFERNHVGYEDWGQMEKLTANDPDGDSFGVSVGISGDTVVVGAPYDDDGGYDSGSAYLFKRNAGGVDNWGQVGKLTADDAAADDEFGWSVGISGNTVVVGSARDDDACPLDPNCNSGSTYVFRWGAAEVHLPLVVKD